MKKLLAAFLMLLSCPVFAGQFPPKANGGLTISPEAGVVFGRGIGPMIGVRVAYVKNERNAFVADGSAFLFPKVAAGMVTGYPVSNPSGQPRFFSIWRSTTGVLLTGGYNRSLTGDFTGGFTFYGGAHAGFLLAAYENHFIDVTDGYDVGDKTGTYGGLLVRTALGIETDAGSSRLYVEAEGNFATSGWTGIIIGLRAGMRIGI